ncbi:LPXTG cell wall anchor domain-containing protein [Microbacterium azadirachtae]|uniref:ParB-like protein n=1 Tax=Microbacterium azadirachtae TaxID=582680 RepID=UPI0021D4E77D|nr:ParB-like protein [Microbacterium azadirachtae]UXW86178.1 LPXTG cell wall anchor domain-containing protein [Microbacterium azadirachtae]
MPLLRSRRTLAVALASFLTLGGSVLAAAPASAADAPTDVKDASCAVGDTRDLCAPVGELLDVRIGDVHPTQPSLGYDEVYYKLGRYDAELSKDAINKKFADWCEANGQQDVASAQPDATLTDPSTFTCTVPVGGETAATIEPMKTVVIGPHGVLYLTDGHHTLTSFQENSGPDVRVRLRVLGNLSGLSDADFWNAMQANKWTWLRDVNGDAITPAQLPSNVGLSNFEDDRFRSILYFARDIGYSADGAVPFQEFYWGTWLRTRADIPVAGWNQDDWAGSLALVKQLTQAQVALGASTVVDPQSGYTAGDLSVLSAWNDGKAEGKGEWAKLAKPYTDAKPGKLAYMTEYRLRHVTPAPTAPSAPAAPSAVVGGASSAGSHVTLSWTAPADGGSPITGYTVSLGAGLTADVDARSTSFTFDGVAPGSYSATVTAHNAIGSTASAATPVAVADPAAVQGAVAISGDLRPGGTVTVSATGLASDVAGFAVEVHSDPVSLGTGSTDAAGAFTLQAALPASLPAGAHTVTVSFGGTTVASASFTVVPASAGNGGGSTPGSGSGGSAGSGSASAGSLATTGSEAPIGLGIAGVVVIAAGVLLLARRRADLDAD